MYILGYSGINGYIDIKRNAIKDCSFAESVVGQGMDAAATLFKDGKIIAAMAEERFTGKKHTGDLPVNAIKECLKMAKIKLSDVDIIAHGFNYQPYEQLFRLNDYTQKLYDEVLSDEAQIKIFKQHFNMDIAERFQPFNHHDCHAKYVYETSGFDEALVIILDGIGEVDSISIYVASNKGLKKICHYGADSSIGMLYAAVTEFLGFITNSDEYKVMGLAAFGNEQVYKKCFDELVECNNGIIKIKDLLPEKIEKPDDRDTFRYFKNILLKKGLSKRNSEEPITQQHKDIAAALQNKTNEIICELVRFWVKKTGLKNVCLGGGVALNCVANSYILDHCGEIEHLFVAPASGDDGTAIGAALLALEKYNINFDETHVLELPFYGPIAQIEKDFTKEGLTQKVMDNQSLCEYIAHKIALDNKIIAWVEGGMEFGPRALGHRSILANPKELKMKEKLNRVIKQREDFRPFAPMVKKEKANHFFEISEKAEYQYMIMNARVKEDKIKPIEAATHVDGTARIQSITKEKLPRIWNLLNEIEKINGVPIVINTSFNLKNKPIVCSFDDAVDSFLNSEIDMLVVENTIFEKD